MSEMYANCVTPKQTRHIDTQWESASPLCDVVINTLVD